MSSAHYNPEPLTSKKTALVLVDHQAGLMTGIRGFQLAVQISRGGQYKETINDQLKRQSNTPLQIASKTQNGGAHLPRSVGPGLLHS